MPLLLLIIVACDSTPQETYDYAACSVENQNVYYELVDVAIDGESVPNGMKAPPLIRRFSHWSDVGGFRNADTDEPITDTGRSLDLDLEASAVYYVRK